MPSVSQLAVPGVITLITFLAYGSQLLFNNIEPGPLNQKEALLFNALVGCIWICYGRACSTSPGQVPSNWTPSFLKSDMSGSPQPPISNRQRWCRKCEAFKPSRAHHCKVCQRCILKMDHHCPWTANCVSHRTFPHFFRFLFYAVISMSYLECFLYIRVGIVWSGRNLPSYLGPSPAALIFLFIISVANSTTLFALAILLARNIWILGSNVSTIEGWEIERHETLLRRAKVLGGYLDGPDGIKVKITRQEYPYDIGIYQNIQQGMGGIFVFWLWPFAATPPVESGLNFETNGFEDPTQTWPPPDPDRMPRQSTIANHQAFTYEDDSRSSREQLDAFRHRQAEDLKRYHQEEPVARRRPFHERYKDNNLEWHANPTASKSKNDVDGGEEAWRDSEGDRLDDFGVDEDIEFYDEDDIPLAKLLLEQRKGLKSSSDDSTAP